MADDGAELLTVTEYAALFRKHPDAVYRRIRRGKFVRFPLERDGRSVLILVPRAMVERLRRAKQAALGDSSRP